MSFVYVALETTGAILRRIVDVYMYLLRQELGASCGLLCACGGLSDAAQAVADRLEVRPLAVFGVNTSRVDVMAGAGHVEFCRICVSGVDPFYLRAAMVEFIASTFTCARRRFEEVGITEIIRLIHYAFDLLYGGHDGSSSDLNFGRVGQRRAQSEPFQ